MEEGPLEERPGETREIEALLEETSRSQAQIEDLLRKISEGLDTPSELENMRDKVKRWKAKLESLELQIKILETEDAIRKLKKLEDDKDKGRKEPSRRQFIKRAAAIVAGSVAGAFLPSSTEKDGTDIIIKGKEKLPREWIISNEIRQCRKIIEEQRYEEVLENPFLVSALFYSEEFIKSTNPPDPFARVAAREKNGPEEIITEIYPLITRQFREKFISTLKEKIQKGGSAESRTENPNAESLPLDSLHIGENLAANHPNAIDLFMKEGSPVYSVSAGIVVLAENGWSEADDLSTSTVRGGNTVIIFNPHNETFYRYAHLQSSGVRAGMILENGDNIGVVGHSGINASRPGHGEHVHFGMNRYDREQGRMMTIGVFDLSRRLKALVKK